jgi:choice-of-anchor C domain-containing protein
MMLFFSTGKIAIRSAFAAGFFAIVSVAPANAASIINGSFEQGVAPGSFTNLNAGSPNITGWSIDAGSVDYIGSYWQAADGSRSIDLNGLTAGTISQTITGLTIGQAYNVSFELAGNPDGNPTVKTLDAIVASVGNFSFSFDASGSTHSNMGWAIYSFIFTASATDLLLSFASTIPGAYGPALDNVSITETPLPGALPLFAGGLGGMAFLARRRKKKAQSAA